MTVPYLCTNFFVNRNTLEKAKVQLQPQVHYGS